MDTSYMLASQLQAAFSSPRHAAGPSARVTRGDDDIYARMEAQMAGARSALVRFVVVIASLSLGVAAFGLVAREGGAAEMLLATLGPALVA